MTGAGHVQIVSPLFDVARERACIECGSSEAVVLADQCLTCGGWLCTVDVAAHIGRHGPGVDPYVPWPWADPPRTVAGPDVAAEVASWLPADDGLTR